MASAPIDLNPTAVQETGHSPAQSAGPSAEPSAVLALSAAPSYMPALDGLRALAVLAVIFYHANLPAWLPGGFLGVECFFVISGFLITSLLLAEWERNGRLNFSAFWLRRARRLLPALFLLLIGVLTYSVLFLPGEVAALRRDAGAAAVYVSNWYLIFSHQSYFEAVGRPPLLRHLWSLAVEEQFYLLWPLIFGGLMFVTRSASAEKRRRVALLLIIAGAIASSVLMAALYQPMADPSRPYYGTDTRAAGLLIGAALALLWAPGRARFGHESAAASLAQLPALLAAGAEPSALFPQPSVGAEASPATPAGAAVLLSRSSVVDTSPAIFAAGDADLTTSAGIDNSLAASAAMNPTAPDETAAVDLSLPTSPITDAGPPALAAGETETATSVTLDVAEPLETAAASYPLAPAPVVEATPSVGPSAPEPTPAPAHPFRLRVSLPLILDVVGLFALAGLFAAFFAMNEFQSFLYLGGFSLVSLATALVIAASVDTRARVLPRLLGWGPLRWIGLRSYGLYLWHWPVFQLTRPQLDLPLDGLPLFALRMAITLLVVELSYRLIEMPVRKGALGRAWQRWRESSGHRRARLTLQWVAAACALLVFGAVLGNSVVNAQPPPPPDYLAALASPLPGDPPGADPPALIPTPIATPQSAPGDSSAGQPVAAPTPQAVASASGAAAHPAPAAPVLVTVERPAAYAPHAGWPGGLRPVVLELSPRELLAAAEPGPATGSASLTSGSPSTGAPTTATTAGAAPAAGNPSRPLTLTLAQPAPLTSPLPLAAVQAPVTSTTATLRITAIGDSVMRGAAKQLLEAMPGMEIDANIGRLPWDVTGVVQAHLSAGNLRSVVVIHTGGNGIFTAQMLDQIMALLADRKRVVFLTVKVPRAWESYNNRMLEANVKRYPNAVLVDWRVDSLSHPEWFWGDAIHLREDGARVFARLIADAVFAP
jgi:peptidoglycan/LPS O-acetylase OafA/YrhL